MAWMPFQKKLVENQIKGTDCFTFSNRLFCLKAVSRIPDFVKTGSSTKKEIIFDVGERRGRVVSTLLACSVDGGMKHLQICMLDSDFY